MPEYYDERNRKRKKRDRKGEGPISRYKRKMYGSIDDPYCEAGMRVDPKLAKKRDDERFDRFGEDTESNEDLSHLNSVEKLLLAVEASIYYLPSEVAEEIKAIFTPATLATMVGVFAVYLAAHATGIGQAMDIGMLVAGGIYFGLDAFAIFKDIAGFAGAVNATTPEELVEAGEHLASAVAKIGVDAVMTLLSKKVADRVADTKQITELAQPDLIRGDTLMSDELLESIKQKRFVHVVEPGSDEARYLERYRVNAVAGNYEKDPNPNNLNAITVRSDAKKIEILEEFLHGTQAKLDMTGSTENTINLEIHVKDFMIRHKDMLGLSDKDIKALTIMKRSYEQQ